MFPRSDAKRRDVRRLSVGSEIVGSETGRSFFVYAFAKIRAEVYGPLNSGRQCEIQQALRRT
jgi:hypothetical protein